MRSILGFHVSFGQEHIRPVVLELTVWPPKNIAPVFKTQTRNPNPKPLQTKYQYERTNDMIG